MSDRYAVYLAPPPDSALWRFGAQVLGRDAATGETIEGFAPDGFTGEEWRALTQEPRRYGFHATLKAPFRLRDGLDVADLEAAIAAIAATTVAFDAGPLQVSAVTTGGGAFVALTPRPAAPALFDLEARAVVELDAFRATPTPEERARRRLDRLTPRQRLLFEDFGYPFVREEFRPHFTLTGPCAQPESLVARLSQAFAQSGAAGTFRVDALALFEQWRGGPFRATRRFALRGAAG